MSATSWIQSDSGPNDFYELLGRPRFDPASEELLAAIRKANRQILPYQNHGGAEVRSRALQLLRDLGRAEDTFSNANRRAAYDGELARALIQEFNANPAHDLRQLPRWLLHDKQVHRDGLKLILAELPPSLRRTRSRPAATVDPSPSLQETVVEHDLSLDDATATLIELKPIDGPVGPITVPSTGGSVPGVEGRSTGTSVVSWLKADSSPGDYYELVGRPRFDPARDEVLAAIRSANRQVWTYRNHLDPAVRVRVLLLLRDLARAEEVFSDTGKLVAYQTELARSLFEDYRARLMRDGNAIAFKDWLLEVKGVHPEGLGATLALLSPLSQDVAPAGADETSDQAAIQVAPVVIRPSLLPQQHLGVNTEIVSKSRDSPTDGLLRTERETSGGPETLAELHPTPDGDELASRPPLDLLEIEPESWPSRAWLVLLMPAVLTGIACLLAWPWLQPVSVDPSKLAKGSLDVVVRGGKATLLVDGLVTPLDATNQARISLPPGQHKVQAIWGDTAGDVHSLSLDPGQHRALEITPKPRTHALPDLGAKTIDAEGWPETWKRYEAAQRLQKASDWESSIQEYSRSLAEEETFWPSLAGRGECHFRRGRFQDARKDLEAARNLEPGSALVCLRLGDASLETGDLTAARRYFANVLSINPRAAEAHAGIGLAYYYEGKFKEAIDACEDGLRLEPSCTRIYLVRAAAREENDQWQLAASNCLEALRIDPSATLAHAIRAEALRNGQRPDEAAEAERVAATFTPLTAIELNYMAGVFRRLSGMARAKSAYDQALDRIPHYVVALGNRASLLSREKETRSRALADLDRAITLTPDVPFLYYLRSFVYSRMNRYDQALGDAEEAVKRSGKTFRFRAQLGLAFLDLRQYQKAIEAFSVADGLWHSDPYVHQMWGYAAFCAGLYDEAVKEHERAVELDGENHTNRPVHVYHDTLPKSDRRLLELSRAFIRRGERLAASRVNGSALRAFDDAIQIAPQSAVPYVARGNFHLGTLSLDKDLGKEEKEKSTKALSDFEKARELDGQNAEAHYKIGLIRLRRQEWQKALLEFNKAIELRRPPYLTLSLASRCACLLQLGRSDSECLADADRAIQSGIGAVGKEDLATAYLVRGLIRLRSDSNDDHKKAARDLREAVKYSDTTAQTHHYLGIAYFLLGDLRNASRELQKASTLDQRNGIYAELIAVIERTERKDYRGALDRLQGSSTIKKDEKPFLAMVRRLTMLRNDPRSR
jgi:tetratricopeptide (TPR) repeat protein